MALSCIRLVTHFLGSLLKNITNIDTNITNIDTNIGTKLYPIRKTISCRPVQNITNIYSKIDTNIVTNIDTKLYPISNKFSCRPGQARDPLCARQKGFKQLISR